ncbi:MAG: DNA-directed RNA polymerase subunit beta' [Aureliella sp.]
MSTAETTGYDRVNDFTSVKISLARPQDIRSWSFGEVKKPETINYRTYRPEKDGLFCERIFGPEKDWECACGKYRGMKYKGMICDRCGVKVTHSRVRRKRMGHIELAAPIVHIWFFKAMPSRLGALLGMKTSSLEKIIYFQDYVVLDPKETDLEPLSLLSEGEYREARQQYGDGAFEAGMGAEAIRTLLTNLDLTGLGEQLRKELNETNSKQKKKDLSTRLKLVESIRDSDNRPEWMVFDVIPVIPPDLRPLVLLDSGNFATSDLNDLYRRIINRNNRLRKLVDLNAPEVIIRNEKRMLQQSVDALFDNNRCKRPVLGSSNRPLKSLTDMIKGKQGRFRENLLGKRVDYSARSVIVVGPRLRLHQCGLPKKIALELYQPFIIRKLKDLGHADTIKSAKKMLERKDEEVWDILEQVIRNHPVLLNRAPTLHRMGIQAFEPILVEGNAIHLHPLACKGFNADFDGDQMAVHLPLSLEAQVEAHTLMMSTHNIFAPSNGRPIMSPSQDTVMGCYFITVEKPGMKGEGMVFSSMAEADLAFNQGIVHLHAKIKVRLPKHRRLKSEDGTAKFGDLVETTYGRVLFNMMLPDGLDFYNFALRGSDLASVISDCYQRLGRRATINLLDDMNQLGFRESTRSGLSFGTDDLVTPDSKFTYITDTEKQVMKLKKSHDRGLMTGQERYRSVLDLWTHARENISRDMMQAMEHDEHLGDWYVNPVFLMAHSGARGGIEQIRQLAGMRGLMAKPTGEIIETPIKANFREGLGVLEYFSSTHGARKGLADTALKTADSGYLTRKLADVAQNVVITLDDCGTTQGITKGVVYRGEKVEVRLIDSINGRVSRQNIVNPVTDEVIVKENQMIDLSIARKIEELGLEKIQVRSPMTCDASLGVCRKCYGMDMSTGAEVEEGMAVGIIAAQSIGEPGTQLTMRTFHIGGAVSTTVEDNEIKSKSGGTVKFAKMRSVTNEQGVQIVLTRNSQIVLLDPKGREIEKYDIPAAASLKVAEDDVVEANTALCEWNPHKIPIICEVGGKVRFDDVVEGETMRLERDPSGGLRQQIVDHKGDLHPQIVLEDADGNPQDVYYLPERAEISVEDGAMVAPGTELAQMPRESKGVADITGGLPRVTEIFEARKPKDPAVVAEVDGVVELAQGKRRGKRIILVRTESGTEHEHLVPPGKRFLVHTGDEVKAGQALVDGPLVPHDILRVSGEEAVQQYLTHEIQQVYRSQRVEINDKHVEVIIARMLRKVKIETPGDTSLLPGLVMDKFEFRRVNEELGNCLKITEPGDSDYSEGTLVPKETLEQTNLQIEGLGGNPAKGKKPKPATASTQLLGITKASVQSSSFISAASFQETTKVLTEAALAGKVDRLVGLKENVILGHLIPAGTGFRTFQESEVSYRREALEDLVNRGTEAMEESFTLLDQSPGAPGAEAPAPVDPAAPSLDALIGGGSVTPPVEAPVAQPVISDAVVTEAEVQPVTHEAIIQDTGAVAPTGSAVIQDDLTKIEGIGPKIAEFLSASGISSYIQLSQVTPEQLGEVLGGGGFAAHDPGTWPEQARMAAAGEWDALKQWQDQLDGGRPVDAPDDLTKIEGIGPKVAELFYGAGITSYAALAATTAEEISGFLAEAGGIMATMNPATWPQQAQMAANGQWEELQKWQDELDGGV